MHRRSSIYSTRYRIYLKRSFAATGKQLIALFNVFIGGHFTQNFPFICKNKTQIIASCWTCDSTVSVPSSSVDRWLDPAVELHRWFQHCTVQSEWRYSDVYVPDRTVAKNDRQCWCGRALWYSSNPIATLRYNSSRHVRNFVVSNSIELRHQR